MSKKLDQAARAEDLYVSSWFKKARTYVTTNAAPWRILSAKHGLLHPDEMIEPYEVTLNKMPIAERRAWAASVLVALRPLMHDGDAVVILAGERYRQFLVPELRAQGIRVHVPLEGLGLGQQLRWFDEHT